MNFRSRAMLITIFVLVAACTAKPPPPSVFLEDLTWTEVRDQLRAGGKTILIPTGGTEQNGPHMVLGKHNLRVRLAAGEIAKRLGKALVAPVMAYVPEGDIDPPTGHMWAPGTITVTPELFASVVESAARGFAAQGFTDIVLLGDSGPNQTPLQAVAEKLNAEWAQKPARVLYASDYYQSQGRAFSEWLKSKGLTQDEIGEHAGSADTSLLMAVQPQGVRMDRLARGRDGDGSGVIGDPRKAKAAYGEKGLQMAIDAAVKQVESLRVSTRAAVR